MAIFVPRFLRQQRDVDTTGAAVGDVLTLDGDGETWVAAAGGGGGGDVSDAVILAPASSARNVIIPVTGDVIATTVRAHAAQSVNLAEWQLSTADLAWGLSKEGAEILAATAVPADADVPNSQRWQWYEDTVGAPSLRFIQRDSAGTLFKGRALSSNYNDGSVRFAADATAPYTLLLIGASGEAFDESIFAVQNSALEYAFTVHGRGTAIVWGPAAQQSLEFYAVGADLNTELDYWAILAKEGADTRLGFYYGGGQGATSAGFPFVAHLGAAGDGRMRFGAFLDDLAQYRPAATVEALAYGNFPGAGDAVPVLGIRVVGSAALDDLVAWTIDNDPDYSARLGGVKKDGTIYTRVHAAPADATLSAGDLAWWYDQTNGAAKWRAKGKTADGTVVNWEIPAGDLATQAELDAHVNDAADAHDASAISVADVAGDYTATDVEGVLAEIAPQLGGGAVAAEDVSFTPAGTIAATDVQAAIEEVAAEAGGGGAPTTAPYVTTAADAGLSAEAVLGTAVIMAGTLASLPAAGTAGRLYFVTDDFGGYLLRDTGAAWVEFTRNLSAAYPYIAASSAKVLTNMEKWDVGAATAFTTGRLVLTALWLPRGFVVNSLTFRTGTTALGVGVNQFFGLYDDDAGSASGTPRDLLAASADDGSTAWAGATAKTLNMITPYTVLKSGIFRPGVLIVATTMPTILNATNSSAQFTNAAICGQSGTAQTALPDPAAAVTTTFGGTVYVEAA